VETFRWLAVTFSMVLGLGVARVLSGVVAVFKSRHHAEIDWVPLVWGAATFVLQVQFWWALIELPAYSPEWTLGHFLVVLGIPLMLFAAAAIILPSTELGQGESHRELFQRDGRWGLVCLSAYAALAILVDALLFGEPLLSRTNAYLFGELTLPLLFLMVPTHGLKHTLTVGYLILVVWASLELSPGAY